MSNSPVTPCLAALLAFFTPAAMAAELLQAVEYHAEEVNTKSGLTWLGLFPKGKGQFELKETRVIISRVNDPIADNPRQKTGKKVSTSYKGEPLFLVRGVAGLKAGKVATCVVRTDRLIGGEKIKLQLSRSVANLVVEGERKKDEEFQQNYSVILERDGIEQSLYSKKEIGIAGSPILLWSGDLDGDGKVDLLIDTTEDYNMSQPTLFLSSKAKPGKLVQKVASRTSYGC